MKKLMILAAGFLLSIGLVAYAASEGDKAASKAPCEQAACEKACDKSTCDSSTCPVKCCTTSSKTCK